MAYREKNRGGLTALTTLTSPGGVIGKLLAVAVESEPPTESPEPRARPPTSAEILAMSYQEFAKADLVITIRSAVLGDDVQLASTEEAAQRAHADRVVFLLDEFRHLYATGKLDVEALRALHRHKKLLGNARLRGYMDRDGSRSGELE